MNPQTKSPTVNRAALVKLLMSGDGYGTPLFAGVTAVVREDGGEGIGDYHPTTIREELRDILRIQSIPDGTMDVLMAAAAIAHTDLFYRNLPDFVDICNILSGTSVSPAIFDPADAYEIAWALTEAYLLDPPDHSAEFADRFSEEIRSYVGVMAAEAGLLSLPPPLAVGILPRETKVLVPADPELAHVTADADREHHLQINDMVQTNLAELLEQMQALWPGYDMSLG